MPTESTPLETLNPPYLLRRPARRCTTVRAPRIFILNNRSLHRDGLIETVNDPGRIEVYFALHVSYTHALCAGAGK